MKTIIAGSRGFDNYEQVKEILNIARKLAMDNGLMGDITEVVCGGARGIDLMGKRWAEENGIPVKLFPADWDKLGKKAGFIRNEEMGKYADCLVAIWDGQSSGTKHMLDFAKKKKLYVILVTRTKDGELIFS